MAEGTAWHIRKAVTKAGERDHFELFILLPPLSMCYNYWHAVAHGAHDVALTLTSLTV